MCTDFVRYVRAEIIDMGNFRRDESKRLGRELTRNEAALRWVDEGHAAQFRDDYEKRK